MTCPAVSLIGDMVMETSILRPSLRTCWVSKGPTCCPCLTRSRLGGIACSFSGETSSEIGWPMISAGE